MNITLVHWLVHQALVGPYLSIPQLSHHQFLSLGNGQFSNFFSNFIFARSPLNIAVTHSDFKHFQSSAVALSSASGLFENQIYYDTQSVTQGDIQGEGSKATFKSCIFYNCNSPNTGGAILSESGIRVFIDSCQFVRCSAKDNGGALSVTNYDGWLGNWNNGQNLPSFSISKSCFVECMVQNDPTDVSDNTKGVGFVVYTKAVQVFFNDFSMIDCARDGTSNVEAVFGWINEMKTSNGNLSILSYKPSNMGAFNIRYVGRTTELTGRWLSVKHENHYVSGFNCQYVYWAHLHEGICNHELSNIDVVNTVFSGENCAIFYGEKGNVDDWKRSKSKLTNCQVFNVENSEKGVFCKHGLGEGDIEYTNCKCNVENWKVDGKVSYVTEYVPNENLLIDSVECDYVPPESSGSEESSYEDIESEADDSEVTGETFESDEVSQNNPTGKGAMPPEAIAGIVIGIFVIVAIVLVIIFFVVRRKKTSSGTVREENEMESEPTTVTTTTGTAYPLVTTGNYNETQLNQVFEASDSFRDSAEEEI